MPGRRRVIRVRSRHPSRRGGRRAGEQPGTAHTRPFPRTIRCAQKVRAVFYDLYPEWGPASHNPDNPHSVEAVQTALDLRDNGGLRPDDN